MASIDRLSVKAEAVGAFNCDIKNFADAIFFCLENDDLVSSGAAHQTRRIRLAFAFTQDFDAGADQSFVPAPGGGIDNSEQVLVARIFYGFLDLIGHPVGARLASRRIAK